VTIAASKFCSSECAVGTSFTVVLVNALNPAYINSPLTNSVAIYTMNYLSSAYYVIDQITTGVYFTNSLLPGALTSMTLTRTGSSLTGGIPTYTFSFKTATILSSGSVFLLVFPTATAYITSSTTVTCTVGGTSKTCTTTALSTDST